MEIHVLKDFYKNQQLDLNDIIPIFTIQDVILFI